MCLEDLNVAFHQLDGIDLVAVVQRANRSSLGGVANAQRRIRGTGGRRGLDILNEIQKQLTVPVEIQSFKAEKPMEVDSMLLKMAEKLDAFVMTNDFNLNKVAEFQGVRVLNINELANAIKPVVLPGEEAAETTVRKTLMAASAEKKPLVSEKFIETVEDDERRVRHEENRLHVQNMVLDNCLSTIKHETIYYPNRIKQLVNRINEHDERLQMKELVDYYKVVFTTLTECASRQLDEVTFRRAVVDVGRLLQGAVAYHRKRYRNSDSKVLVTDAYEGKVTCDNDLIGYLFEQLIDAALLMSPVSELQLTVKDDGDFVSSSSHPIHARLLKICLSHFSIPHVSVPVPCRMVTFRVLNTLCADKSYVSMMIISII